jgi:hypothetical protein
MLTKKVERVCSFCGRKSWPSATGKKSWSPVVQGVKQAVICQDCLEVCKELLNDDTEDMDTP